MDGKKTSILGLLFIYILGIMYFASNIPFGDTYLFGKYLFVFASYLIMFPIILCVAVKMDVYIFEPFTMIVGLTFLTYSVGPMMSVILGDISLNGFDVFDGCIEATMIYMISLIVFMLVYYSKSKYTDSMGIETEYYVDNDADIQKIVFISYILLFIGMAVNIYDMLLKGFSLDYVLSLGMQGNRDMEIEAESIGGLSSFGSMIFIPLLYLDKYERKKWLPFILRIICIVVALTRGTRFPLIVLVLSPIVMYFIERKKSPTGSTVLLIAVLDVLLVGGVQMLRTSTRMGTGIEGAAWEQFNGLYIYGAFQGNFDMYKTLYAAINYFPSKEMFTFGQQMILCTLIWMIPRSIWHGKPVSYAMDVIKGRWMGEGAVRGAFACGQLTEYYFEFGIIGCIVFMGLFARLCQYLKVKYVNPENTHDYVMYAIMFPTLMQLVIRGATQMNVWSVVFMLLPMFAAKFVTKIR